MRRLILSLLGLFLGTSILMLAAGRPAAADDFDQLTLGVQPDGRIVVPTNQVLKPAGKQITFPGRPVDLALAEEGKILVVKNMRDLIFIDLGSCQIKQTLRLPRSARNQKSPLGFSVVGLLVADGKIYASDAQQHVRITKRQADGRYAWVEPIEVAKPKVGGPAHPAGLCRPGAEKIWVTASRRQQRAAPQRCDRTDGTGCSGRRGSLYDLCSSA